MSYLRVSYTLGMQDIGLRYKRSLLGPFWLSASMVSTVLALSYLFSGIYRQEFLAFTSFLGLGLLTWQFLVSLITEGCAVVTEHEGFLKNVPMPLSALAARLAVRNVVIFLHNFVAVIVLLAVMGWQFQWTAVAALPGAACIAVFGYFAILTLGPICARFRDIPQVVGSAIQVLFFLTPIVWMPSQTAHRPMLTASNPFYHMIELVRAPVLGSFATPLNWTVSLVVCGVMAVLAIMSVSLTRRRVALWL